jgi:ParB/RepB/Spo0J family partition protein
MPETNTSRFENLDALAADVMSGWASNHTSTPSRPRLVQVRPDQIVARSPIQTRRAFDPEGDPEDVEFVHSIRQHGVLQPVLTYMLPEGKGYGLIAGHRRLDAAIHLGLEAVPAIMLPATPAEEMRDVWTALENLQRKDLKPLEKAEQIRRLIDRYHYTQRDLARLIGVSQAQISHLLNLITAPPEIQEAVNAGRLGVRNAREVVRMPEEARRSVLEMTATGIPVTAAFEMVAPPASGQAAKTARADKSGPASNPVETLLGAQISLFAQGLKKVPNKGEISGAGQLLLAGLWLSRGNDMAQAWDNYRALPQSVRTIVEKILIDLHRLSMLARHSHKPQRFEPALAALILIVKTLFQERSV